MLNKIKQIFILQAIEHSLRTLILSLGLTAFICFGFQYFYLEDDLMKTFPQNLKSKVIWNEIQTEFGETEFVFIAFGQDSLGYNILNDKNAIRSTQLLTSAIENNLSHYINKVISIANFNIISGDSVQLDIGLLLDENFTQYVNDSNYYAYQTNLQDIAIYFNNNPNQKQRLVSINDQYLNIAVRPKGGVNMSEVIPKIKKLTNQYLNNYDIHYAGQPYLGGETPNLIKKDVSMLMGIGILIMLTVLFVNLRSIFSVFIIILTILCSLFSMLGFMGWMRFLTGTVYFDFTMMNTSMPIILLTIANSDGVHIVSRFFREFRKFGNKKEALTITMNALIQPIFLTSLTTSVAFMTMIFSPLEYMIGYAFGIAFGVMWALFLSCTMIPSLLMLRNWSLNSKAISKESILEKLTSKISKLVFYYPKQVLISGLLIIFISLIGIWFISVEVNIMKFFKRGSSLRDSTEFIDNNFAGTMNLSVALNSDLTDYNHYLELYNLQDYLDSINHINMTFSIIDVLGQSYKTYMNVESEFIPDQDALDGVYSLLSISGTEDLEDDLKSLLGKDYDDGFYEVNQSLLTAMIKSISTAEIQDLVALTELYIEENINSQGSNTKVEISGLSVFINEFVNIILKSAIVSILLSILLILIITWIFFRSFKWGILSIVPLASAVILNFGLMGLTGIHLNHMTALLSSVIIGVGVDFSIHYISDYRRNLIGKININEINIKTSENVGYPILLDVGSNMGFIALFASTLIPLNHMGGLMVLAMISTSFGTLTILASLIQILKVRKV